MGNSIISRKGGSGVKGVGKAQASAENILVIPDLIGVKNAIITLYQNPEKPNQSIGIRAITSIVIEDGVITSANYLYHNGSRGEASIARLTDLAFDSATGTLSKDYGSIGEFSRGTHYYIYAIY